MTIEYLCDRVARCTHKKCCCAVPHLPVTIEIFPNTRKCNEGQYECPWIEKGTHQKCVPIEA